MKLTILKVLNAYFNAIEPIVILMGATKDTLVAFYVTVYGTLLGYDEDIQNLLILQSALETSWFDHTRIVTYNNPFGMRNARTRYSFASGTYLAHASYNSISAGVADRFSYDLYFGTDKTSATAYIQSLIRQGYAEAGNYAATLANMFNGSMFRVKTLRERTQTTTALITTITALGGGLLYFAIK